MVDNLSEMSKIFYQVITLSDCLDRLVETETDIEKIKVNVKSFIIDLERTVKNYTTFEMRLVSLLKEDDTIDFSKLELSDETSKNSNIEVPLSQAETSN